MDTILRYDGPEISETLHLTPNRLLFDALAAGGDYHPGFPGCGPVYASASRGLELATLCMDS